MPKKVKPVPTGYRTVTPYLVVRGADAALAFYEAALGATIVSRHMDETGSYVVHAEMKIGNAIVLLCDEAPEVGVLSPAALGATPVAMHLYLSDLDVAWDRALNNGATVLVPLHDTLAGERFGKIVDPFGHVWTLAMRIALPSNENRPRKIKDAAAAVAPADADEQPVTPVEVPEIEAAVDVTAADTDSATVETSVA